MLALQKQYFFPVKNLNDLNTVPWSASYVGHAKQEISKWMNDDVLKFTKQDLKVWGWLRHRLAPSLCRAGGGDLIADWDVCEYKYINALLISSENNFDFPNYEICYIEIFYLRIHFPDSWIDRLFASRKVFAHGSGILSSWTCKYCWICK